MIKNIRISSPTEALTASVAILVAFFPSQSIAQSDQDECRSLLGGEKVRACSKLIKTDSSNAEPYLMRANGLFEIGQYDRAIEDLQKAILRSPSDEFTAAAYKLRAFSWYKKGKEFWGRAIADLTAQITLGPDAEGYAIRGMLFDDQNKSTKALSDLRMAVRLEPGNSDFREILSEIEEKAGEETRSQNIGSTQQRSRYSGAALTKEQCMRDFKRENGADFFCSAMVPAAQAGEAVIEAMRSGNYGNLSGYDLSGYEVGGREDNDIGTLSQYAEGGIPATSRRPPSFDDLNQQRAEILRRNQEQSQQRQIAADAARRAQQERLDQLRQQRLDEEARRRAERERQAQLQRERQQAAEAARRAQQERLDRLRRSRGY